MRGPILSLAASLAVPLVILSALLLGCVDGAAGTKTSGEEIPEKEGREMESASGPMAHQAFVWQRQWNGDVSRAVREAPRLGLAGLVALGAEIHHRDPAEGAGPRVVRVPVDFAALEAAGPVGLALRIGGLDPAPYPRELVVETARRLVRRARAAGVTLSELQIDHDCPTRRLDECAELLRAIRRDIAPTPLTFTALPSWLGEKRAFESLLRSSDGYVLQVHSLDRPEIAQVLCDPERARSAVAAAARFGRPFRVALPTHSYLVRMDEQGLVRGVDAEDAAPGGRGRIVGSDAAAMAELVREWTAKRPRELEGLLFFRLPVEGDRFNWTPHTLAEVIAGRAPLERLEIAMRRPQPGLVEIELVNHGQTNVPMPEQITLRWSEAPLAGDGLDGYRLDRKAPVLDGRGLLRPLLSPGQARPVAWLRFPAPEVTLEARVKRENAR